MDHFQYFPTDEGFSSDMFFEVFSGRQKKASTNSMTQISLLNDKVNKNQILLFHHNLTFHKGII